VPRSAAPLRQPEVSDPDERDFSAEDPTASGGEDAEAIVECFSLLDSHGLRESARRDREAVEEADASEEDEAVAVPVLDEADLGLPFAIFVNLAVVGMQA